MGAIADTLTSAAYELGKPVELSTTQAAMFGMMLL
jgi:hypothetical protein